MSYLIAIVMGLMLGLICRGLLVEVRKSKGVVSGDITEEHVSELRTRFGSTLYGGVKLWHIQWLVDYVGKERGKK